MHVLAEYITQLRKRLNYFYINHTVYADVINIFAHTWLNRRLCIFCFVRLAL